MEPDLDHIGMENGERVAFADFDYDQVDRALGLVMEAPADVRAEAAELIAQILGFIWVKKPSLRTATMRFAAISAGLRPDLVGRDYKQIAKEIGVTKAAISKSALAFSDACGIKFKRSRPQIGRLHMAAAQYEIRRRALERAAVTPNACSTITPTGEAKRS